MAEHVNAAFRSHSDAHCSSAAARRPGSLILCGREFMRRWLLLHRPAARRSAPLSILNRVCVWLIALSAVRRSALDEDKRKQINGPVIAYVNVLLAPANGTAPNEWKTKKQKGKVPSPSERPAHCERLQCRIYLRNDKNLSITPGRTQCRKSVA